MRLNLLGVLLWAGLGLPCLLPPTTAVADGPTVAGSSQASPQPVVARADERFAGEPEESPSFRQHIIPLAGRLGCNGRSCHGSFQGQGGFMLSLFGYDFDADHKAMLGGDEPRVDLQNPTKSLLLQKPTMEIDHGGEERMKVGSWQYKMFLKWLQDGAVNGADDEPEFQALEVTPKQIVFENPGETVQLRAVVTWADGRREDVTPLTRFQTNDETVARIDENGLVTCAGRGDTHVVAFYDNGVTPVQVMLAVSEQAGSKFPEIAARTEVDRLVLDKLRTLGVVPSAVCTDEEFLRRVSLDMTGTLPTADEVRQFVADASPDKRNKKIEELLQRPSYAAWWATKLCDWTGASPANINENGFQNELYLQWYEWLRRRVEQNVPYDKIVEGMALAVSRQPGQSYEEYCQEMSSYYFRQNGRKPEEYAEHEYMPHFWNRRQQTAPKDKALQFAYAFLGVRLQCAECHKHPFDQWTKQDFDQFTAFFNNIRYGNARDSQEIYREMQQQLMAANAGKTGGELRRATQQMVRDGQVIPWRELYVETRAGQGPRRRPGNNAAAAGGRVITPRLLGGEEVLAQDYPDPRQALFDWMRSEENPYFAKSIVNRVWANYFNVGIIEPPDDMNLANPPSNAPLLDYLTQQFIAQGYDLQWLHREIVNSDAYQRSWRANETNRLDERNFSRAIPRRLPAEVTYDALVQASASDQQIEKLLASYEGRAIGDGAATRQRNGSNYVMALFGRPDRVTSCDCERSNEPSLLQTVFLRNDREVLQMLDRRDGWLADVERRASGRRGDESSDANDALQTRLQQQIERLEGRLAAARDRNQRMAVRQIQQQLIPLREQLEKLQAAQKAANAGDEQRLADDQIAALVEEAYLRTLSRRPRADEVKIASHYLAESESRREGLRDLLWALMNTKEFIINH